MRLIPFALTEPQILAQTKTVTRRIGWRFMREGGDLLQPVDRVLGFKKGEKPIPIGGPIRVVSVRRERLDAISQEDCAAEGFPELSPAQFVEMFCREMKCAPETEVARIEFEFTEPRHLSIESPWVRPESKGDAPFEEGGIWRSRREDSQ